MTNGKFQCIIYKNPIYGGLIFLKKIFLLLKRAGRKSLGRNGSFFLISTAPLVILQLAYALFLFFSLGEYERLCRLDEISLSLENTVLCLFISVLTAFLCDAAERRSEREKNGKQNQDRAMRLGLVLT